MAYNPNVPAPTNLVQDDIAAMRENFQHLDPLAQAVDDLQAVSGLAQAVDELQAVSGLAQAVDELQAVSELAPYVQALLDSRIVEMGTNSNGTYVRWENGLQVCWLFGRTGIAPLDIQPGGPGTFRWFYPAQFSIVPIVFGSPNQPLSVGGGRIVLIDGDISAVSADGYRFRVDSQANSDGPLSLLAIGRWK